MLVMKLEDKWESLYQTKIIREKEFQECRQRIACKNQRA